jgi:uncharacterized protein
VLVIELIAYLAIGALSGVLAGLFGVGGGAVMVPALMLLFGALGIGGDWMAHLAVGTSLATIIGTGAASTLAHHRRGGVRWDIVWPLAPGIVIGALAGAALAGWISGLWLQRIFAVFLASVGYASADDVREDGCLRRASAAGSRWDWRASAAGSAYCRHWSASAAGRSRCPS